MTDDAATTSVDRLLAGFDFARSAAAAQDRHRKELETLLTAWLEVVDALESLERTASAESAQTLTRVRRKAASALEAAGVERLICVGHTVDLETSEVVEVRPVSGGVEDTVVEEIIAGYRWRGGLLRRPKVVVAGAGLPRMPAAAANERPEGDGQ